MDMLLCVHYITTVYGKIGGQNLKLALNPCKDWKNVIFFTKSKMATAWVCWVMMQCHTRAPEENYNAYEQNEHRAGGCLSEDCCRPGDQKHKAEFVPCRKRSSR